MRRLLAFVGWERGGAWDRGMLAGDEGPAPSPPPSPPGKAGPTLTKRRAAESLPAAGRRRVPRVNFSHVSIRSHQLELWGGGGVPGDGGAPLGLGWAVMNERRVPIDEFEDSRLGARRPKDVYGSQGCVDAGRRCELLIRAGSSLKQIRTAKQAVARLNRQRWQASSMLFGNSWLFSAPAGADCADVLSMMGTPNTEPVLLSAARWRSPSAFAEDLRSIIEPGVLVRPDSTADYLSLDWQALSDALARDVFKGQLVLLVDASPLCGGAAEPAGKAAQEDDDLPLWLLEQLVCRVAAALVAAASQPCPPLGSVFMVLQGWTAPRVGDSAYYIAPLT
eukprot:scaffold11425_cov102-Isochrysis_galbana.AAC.5